MKRKVVVHDGMQRGVVYFRTEPVGRRFAPGFAPELTPKQMLRGRSGDGGRSPVTSRQSESTASRATSPAAAGNDRR